MENDWNEMLRRVKACRAAAEPGLMAEIKLTDGTVIQAKGAGQKTLDELDEVLVWLNYLASEKEVGGRPCETPATY